MAQNDEISRNELLSYDELPPKFDVFTFSGLGGEAYGIADEKLYRLDADYETEAITQILRMNSRVDYNDMRDGDITQSRVKNVAKEEACHLLLEAVRRYAPMEFILNAVVGNIDDHEAAQKMAQAEKLLAKETDDLTTHLMVSDVNSVVERINFDAQIALAQAETCLRVKKVLEDTKIAAPHRIAVSKTFNAMLYDMVTIEQLKDVFEGGVLSGAALGHARRDYSLLNAAVEDVVHRPTFANDPRGIKVLQCFSRAVSGHGLMIQPASASAYKM